jgi:hypothetical protein
MTPKEKAIELVDKFKIGDIVTEKLQIVNINIYSKLFALIAVGEIMNVIIGSYDYELEKIYWQEVKKEIELL